MKVIILAAGRGLRLGSMTEHIPKCMLPFGSETILGRQVRILEEAGIRPEDVTIIAGYKAETVTALYNNVIINDDYYKTDNSYSLYLAIRETTDDVLVMDGDLIFEDVLIRQLLQIKNPNWLLCRKTRQSLGDTGAILDEDGSVCGIGKHIGDSAYTYCGIARISGTAARDLSGQLLENKSEWYTVPLARLFGTHLFTAAFSVHEVFEVNTYFDYVNAKDHFGIEKLNIAVTGASGLLGKKVYHILKRRYRVTGLQYSSGEPEFISLDITNRESVKAFFELYHPQIVVNCAGLAEPDRCEADRELALKVNVEAVRILCEVCREYTAKLIHISTDYVFDGEEEAEYEPGHERQPQNYYGHTKVEAENIVMGYKNSLVVRIPIIYGYNDASDKETFPLKVLGNLKKGKTVYMDNKQVRYPVLIDEVAMMIGDSLSRSGILHISSAVPVTKYTWARVIARVFGFDEALVREDRESCLLNRPPHVKLKLSDEKYRASDIVRGTEIMKEQMHCAFKLIYSTHPGDSIYGINVGEFRYKLGQKLGRSLPREIVRKLDYIVPVPSSGLYYAMGVADVTQVPYLQALYKPDTTARSFQIASNRARAQMIRSKILPIRSLLEGKSIALVDEAIFTGTTLKVVCDMCKACNVKKIYIFLPTPPCYNRCGAYVRPERELLSEFTDVGTLRDYFKVEDVLFQPYGNFEESICGIGGICYECFKQTASGIPCAITTSTLTTCS